MLTVGEVWISPFALHNICDAFLGIIRRHSLDKNDERKNDGKNDSNNDGKISVLETLMIGELAFTESGSNFFMVMKLVMKLFDKKGTQNFKK